MHAANKFLIQATAQGYNVLYIWIVVYWNHPLLITLSIHWFCGKALNDVYCNPFLITPDTNIINSRNNRIW